jgi:hypothetical protein
MNNYIIVIIIIIIIFLFSADKNFINKFMDNKMIILLLTIYMLYNNFNIIILFLLLISALLYDENIRNIIYLRYEKNINILKNRIKIFLDIDHSKNINDKYEHIIEEHDEYDDQDVQDDPENIYSETEHNTISDNDELQKLLNEINI